MSCPQDLVCKTIISLQIKYIKYFICKVLSDTHVSRHIYNVMMTNLSFQRHKFVAQSAGFRYKNLLKLSQGPLATQSGGFLPRTPLCLAGAGWCLVWSDPDPDLNSCRAVTAPHRYAPLAERAATRQDRVNKRSVHLVNMLLSLLHSHHLAASLTSRVRHCCCFTPNFIETVANTQMWFG